MAHEVGLAMKLLRGGPPQRQRLLHLTGLTETSPVAG